MNKKLLIFTLSVFITLMAMSYVSAKQQIELDDSYDSTYVDGEVIPITDAENTILKDGKSISKTVKISKDVTTYSKTKKITFECSKKLTKKNIKKGKIGGQYEKNVKKAKSVLSDAKIKSIKIKVTYKKLIDCSGVHKVKIYKATVKYQPIVYKTLTKTTKATITVDEDDYVTVKYINPFNGKKETEYGDMRRW